MGTKVYNVQLKSNDIGIRKKRDSGSANRSPTGTRSGGERSPTALMRTPSHDDVDSESREVEELTALISSGPPSKRGSPQTELFQ